MKKTLKIVFAISFIILHSPGFAQPQFFSLSEVINKVPTQSIPFYATRITVHGYDGTGFRIANHNNIVLGKLYHNAQLTEYFVSSRPGLAHRKFAIPNSNNLLLLVSFGNATDWLTDVLCVVSPAGQVLSTLEVTISGEAFVRQFRINAQNQIIVTTLHPTSTTSVPLNSFPSFHGQRRDVTYVINAQGQFVQISKQFFQPRTYTREELVQDDSDEGTTTPNLWEGNETPTDEDDEEEEDEEDDEYDEEEPDEPNL